MHLPEHLQPFAGVDEADLLRRGDDHGAGQPGILRQRQLSVAGARRQVDDHVVEGAPVDAHQELAQVFVDHRPAPDYGLVCLDEEPHRQKLDPVALQGQWRSGLIDHAGHPHHDGDARPVDVGVEEADLPALHLEGEGQVGGDRRFADAALAAGHGHNLTNAGQHDALRAGGVHGVSFSPPLRGGANGL